MIGPSAVRPRRERNRGGRVNPAPSMPKIPWIDFAKVYPHAHLVVGLMGDATGAPVREACNVLSKLAARHEDGDFAVGIRRDSGATAGFCALADPPAGWPARSVRDRSTMLRDQAIARSMSTKRCSATFEKG